ncbi:MAG: hypothetical protein KC466_10785 [Myxococcales bacterium]|nr:hypothetical protein [Myxococcales bacterium]
MERDPRETRTEHSRPGAAVAIRAIGRGTAIGLVLLATGVAGVVLGPHRDAAEAAFDGVLASFQLPVAVPGGAVLRTPIRGGVLRQGGIDFFPGRTDQNVASLFDYYADRYSVLTRDENESGGTLVFLRTDSNADVDSLDGLSARMVVLQAVWKPDVGATGFVLGVPSGRFRLATYAQAEVGDGAEDGTPEDLPGPPGSERLFSVRRAATRSAEQRMTLYRVQGAPEDVVDYYRTAMREQGWQPSTSALASHGFLFFQKGGRIAQVSVDRDEAQGVTLATVNYVGVGG